MCVCVWTSAGYDDVCQIVLSLRGILVIPSSLQTISTFSLFLFGPFVYSHTSLSQSVNSYIFPFPPLSYSVLDRFDVHFLFPAFQSSFTFGHRLGGGSFLLLPKKLVSFSSFFSFSSQIKTLQN